MRSKRRGFLTVILMVIRIGRDKDKKGQWTRKVRERQLSESVILVVLNTQHSSSSRMADIPVNPNQM